MAKREPDADAPDEKGSGEMKNISGTTAPSIGPHTVIERPPPEERLAGHEQSDTDAMGLEKRREVVGGSYGPSATRQVATYGGVLAIITVLVIGFIVLAGQLDQPPDTVEPRAPWTGAEKEPGPLE